MQRRTREVEQFSVQSDAGKTYNVHHLVNEVFSEDSNCWTKSRDVYRVEDGGWAHATNDGRLLIEKTGELCVRL